MNEVSHPYGSSRVCITKLPQNYGKRDRIVLQLCNRAFVSVKYVLTAFSTKE